jgi:DNA-directed RNA polymerase subunit alpha
MRIRWRGIELPSRITRDDEVSTDAYGRFVIEPFEHGFGTTVGNSLRRVLLSSLEGAAVTKVRVAGVSHEFTAIEGVMEDVTDIILNVKGLVLRLEDDEPKTMHVRREEAGDVVAGDIVADPAIEILNPDHHLATLTKDIPFHLEMTVRRGRGYVPAADNRSADDELGIIPIDSVFSPILRVRYRTEDMRVGQRTNYDRLILEVWTKGTVLPEDALVEAAAILRKHLNPFLAYQDVGSELAQPISTSRPMDVGTDNTRDELLSKPVSVLGLSVRAANCLEAAQVRTIRDLVALTEADLLRFRSFGKTSLHEVLRKLAEIGLQLGTKFDESGQMIEGEGERKVPAALSGPVEPPRPIQPEGTGSPQHMESFTMDD